MKCDITGIHVHCFVFFIYFKINNCAFTQCCGAGLLFTGPGFFLPAMKTLHTGAKILLTTIPNEEMSYQLVIYFCTGTSSTGAALLWTTGYARLPR